MVKKLLQHLRCPLSGKPFELQVVLESDSEKVEEGILLSESGTMFPVLQGVPRLLPDAIPEFESFLRLHVPDFDARKVQVMKRFSKEIQSACRKNQKTRSSFSREWKGHDYQDGKTWNLDLRHQLQQFFRETQESAESLQKRLMLDAGCGNGHLAMELAQLGCWVIAMDFSDSVVEAAKHNKHGNCHFIQADVAFPPFGKKQFDLVHSSGVLIHTPDTRASFHILSSFVKEGGKISIWVYRKRSELIHLVFNRLRTITSRLPAALQIPVLWLFIFFPALILKRLKGKPQSAAELWVEVLDWFTPEFRWEHSEGEVKGWFREAGFSEISISDENHWGFNTTGSMHDLAG